MKTAIKSKYKILSKVMDERTKRLWAAVESKELGWGGISTVSLETGISRTTITTALKEIDNFHRKNNNLVNVRQSGGGRKKLTEKMPELIKALENLIDPLTRGDPESPLRWTCKSTRKLAVELSKKGYNVSDRKIAKLLYELGYSLQATRKSREVSSQHPDRNIQFEFINKQTKIFQKEGQPVISIDSKKKEKVGDFANNGKEWHPKGTPEIVRVHDFVDKKLGKALPYGVYDITKNEGWVSVGIDHDTSEFAGETILKWWKKMGCPNYPKAKKLLILADGGGSNSSRTRLWKIVLQKIANKTGLNITVCHFPPGTSKWNKIEHRMFSHITQNWRGKPLVSHEVIVNLIGNTTTNKGLKIEARLDTKKYETGKKISKKEIEELNIKKMKNNGNWNYIVMPKK